MDDTNEEVKIAVKIIDEGSDFRVRPDGLLEGAAAEAQYRYRHFLLDELVRVLLIAGKKTDAKMGDTLRKVDLNDRAALEKAVPFVNKAAVVAIPLPAALFEEIEKIEEGYLDAQHTSCKDCEDFVDARCNGITERGDLIKALMAAALTLGMDRLLEFAASMLPRHQELSAREYVARIMEEVQKKH